METTARNPTAPAVQVTQPVTRAPAVPAAPATVLTPAPLPGTEPVIVPGVGRVWAYVDRTDDQPPAPAQPQGLPRGVKTTAVLAPTLSSSFAITGWSLSYWVTWLDAFTHALWAVAGTTAAVGAGVAVTATALRKARRRRGGTARATATATGRSFLGGKVTATATAVVKQ